MTQRKRNLTEEQHYAALDLQIMRSRDRVPD